MSLFSWKAEYAVSVPVIDQQHRKLFEIADRLHTAMLGGEARAALGHILDELVTYTREHFATEERLMQTHAYPGYPYHKTEHDQLTMTVLKFQQDFAAGRLAVSVEMLRFVKNWLSHHILATDHQTAHHLRRRTAA